MPDQQYVRPGARSSHPSAQAQRVSNLSRNPQSTPWAPVFPPLPSNAPRPSIPNTSLERHGGTMVMPPPLTRQQLDPYYINPNQRRYFIGVLDDSPYWEQDGRHGLPVGGQNYSAYDMDGYNPLPFSSGPPQQANRQYADVAEAHDHTLEPALPTRVHSRGLKGSKSAGKTSRSRPKNSTVSKADQQRVTIEDMVLPDMALPDKSSMSLNFTNLDEAREAVHNRDLEWKSPSPDDTIPTTNEQRAEYVLRLLLAVRNRDKVLDKDKDSKRYNATGMDDMGGGYYYKEVDMEKVCWELVSIAENLHVHGPNSLSIYDRETLKNIKKDISFTFEERMQYLVKILCFFKSRCDAIMKGSMLQDIVAQPRQKLMQAVANRYQNDNRALLLEAGRKAKKRVREPTSSPKQEDDDDNETIDAVEKVADGPRDVVRRERGSVKEKEQEQEQAVHDVTGGDTISTGEAYNESEMPAREWNEIPHFSDDLLLDAEVFGLERPHAE